jgi:hypothetical protein
MGEPGTGVNWGKVAAGGLVAGLVWTLLSILLLGIVGREFTAALLAGGRAPSSRVQAFMLAANMGAAVWATWLYAVLRAQYGPGVKTGVVAGVAWWLIVSMQSAKWLALSPIPLASAIAPGVLTLPAILLAAIAGGWCYENFRWTRVAAGQPAIPISPPPDA